SDINPLRLVPLSRTQSRSDVFSPPSKTWIGRRRGPPINIFLGENIVLHVTICEKHIVRASSFIIMPNALGIIHIACSVPVPVALNNLVSRAPRNLTVPDRQGFLGSAR